MKLNSLAPGVNQGIVIYPNKYYENLKKICRLKKYNLIGFYFSRSKNNDFLHFWTGISFKSAVVKRTCLSFKWEVTRNYAPFIFPFLLARDFILIRRIKLYFSVLNIYFNMFQILINITRKQTYWKVRGGGVLIKIFTLGIIVKNLVISTPAIFSELRRKLRLWNYLWRL